MRIAVTGAGGQLGHDLARALDDDHDAVLLDRAALDVTDPAACMDALQDVDAVIHAAAWTDVDGAEADPDGARAVNVFGANNVAAAAPYCIFVSTEYVFDGRATEPYAEDAETNPLQVYGETKLLGEQAATIASGNVAIARTSCLYGAARADERPARNFVRAILDQLHGGRPFDVVDDQIGSPTWTADLAVELIRMCEDRVTGVFHVVNDGEINRYSFARAIAAAAGLDEELVQPITTAQAPPRAAARPLYTPLANTRLDLLPRWSDALARALPDILAVG